ncbi:hypothetical protein B0J18DRAFT_446820 [Chaetomium sp. MPI-SDFR-AT-0129]|nr:hypothetical protein B0J18DRAFT_446820 [Chaetomium sp. MPI-SDFR-AT-0129]
MKPSDATRFGALLEWSQQHGAELHPSLEIHHDDVSKYSLRVKPTVNEGLEPGFTAVSCPLSTTLSYLNALIDGPLDFSSPSSPHTTDGAFPTNFTKSVPPHVLGRFFLIKEYLKGKDSYWAPYISTLPSPEQVAAWALPAFWPDSDTAYLEGTNVSVTIEEIQANVKQEFKQARKLLKDEGFPDVTSYTQLLYKWAFSIFTSRSFRPYLILSEADHQHVSGLLPDGVKLDDFSILQPLLDIANHSITAKFTWNTVSSPHPACQLICLDRYQPGEQIYNNYGLKTNSELLLGYGFMLPETERLHNDYIHLRKRQPQPGTGHENDQRVPQSFLISLRPVSDPSSLVANSRLPYDRQSNGLASLPSLRNFEPALLDDLTTTLAEFVEKIIAILGTKTDSEYSQLMRVGVQGHDEETEDGEVRTWLPPPTNANQELAVSYRDQCAKVLIAALDALVGDD